VVKVDTPVPPAKSLWYNDKVDPHAYSPIEAEAILADAGYQKIGGVWKDKDGSALPSLRFFVPLEVVAPTSYTIGRMVVDEALAIGLTNIVLTPMDFATYLYKTFNQWDFELSLLDHILGMYPTHLFYQFSSEENYMGSGNPHGIVYPALDAELSTIYRSLDHSAKVAASMKAQELLMGGTTTSPLPHNVLPADPRSLALPTIPIYSKNFYDVQQPDLRGAVNMFGYGIENMWTRNNIYWNTPNEYRPGTTEKTVVWIEPEFPERLNPLYASSTYAWDYMEDSYDSLMTVNPYTHRDEPWLAISWSYAAVSGGMDVTFNIKLTDPQGQTITWQDGKAVSINDIKFGWDFLQNYAIPQFWGAFRFYDPANTVIVGADTIRARMTTTSQWLVYDLARTAYMLPPQVWTVDPRDGLAWTGVTEITTFDPSSLAYPTVHNTNPGPIGLPTQLFGTGHFILQHSTSFINSYGYGDLRANRNYFMRTSDIMDKIEYMFWRAGDAVNDDEIDLDDQLLIMKWYGQTVPPAPPEADITGPAGSPPDGYVDIDDLATAGKHFGETETVPHIPPSEPYAPTPVIYVDPPLVTGVFPSETFTVNIMIREAIDVYAWKAELSFAKYMSILEVVEVTEGDFLKSVGSTAFAQGVDPIQGLVKVQAGLLGDVPGVFGDGVLATVRFRVLAEGESPLDLRNTRVKDPGLNHIAHSTENGYFQWYAAKVFVDPASIVGPPPRIGETFTVNISISDVHDLYVWQAGMTFNATVLEALNIAEGEFLKRAGVPTLWTPGSIDNTNGIIHYSASSVTGPTPGVSGSGQLMSATFRVKDVGNSTLYLTDILLLDSDLVSIEPVYIVDGYVEFHHTQDIAILNVTTSATEAYPTWTVPLNINVVVENQGTATETFDVEFWAEGPEWSGWALIETKTVTLAAGANTTLVFNWNITGIAEGIYTIWVEAIALSGETDTEDNFIELTDIVKIKLPGDANDDSVVNAYDLGILAKAWTASGGTYDARADFNGDGTIDTLDHDILKAYWP
jgi:hypothetical protein